MSAATPREQVGAALTGGLPPGVFQVYLRDASPDQVAKPTVIVRVDEVTPEPQAGPTFRAYQFGLIVTVPQIDPEKYATALDWALEDLLHAIDQAPNLTWTRARRVVLAGPQTAGYEVTTTVHTNHESEPTP